MSHIELTSYNLLPYNTPSYVDYLCDYAESVSDSESVTEYDSDIDYQTVVDMQEYYIESLESFLGMSVDDYVFDDVIYDYSIESNEVRVCL